MQRTTQGGTYNNTPTAVLKLSGSVKYNIQLQSFVLPVFVTEITVISIKITTAITI